MRYEQMIHRYLRLLYPSLVNDRYVQMHLNLWFRRETAKVDILETALLMTVGLSPEFIRELIIENSKNPTSSVNENTETVSESPNISQLDKSIIDRLFNQWRQINEPYGGLAKLLVRNRSMFTDFMRSSYNLLPEEEKVLFKKALDVALDEIEKEMENENED